MTKATEIAATAWQTFCEYFTRQHRGWLTSIEAVEIDPRRGDAGPNITIIARDLPLQGVTLEQRAAELDLLVTVGKGRELFTHRVPGPTRIFALETGSGAHEGLRVEGDRETAITLQFRFPVKPETLNGWVEP